jgi:hypothetical protein
MARNYGAMEHLLHRLSDATGESREEILQEFSIGIDTTVAAEEMAEQENDSDADGR